MADRVLITGANGHLGRRLIELLVSRRTDRTASDIEIVAVVRSRAARAALEPQRAGADIAEIDYADAAQLTRAMTGCTVCVHLVGIIKETSRNRYVDAHERASEAVRAAAAANGVARIVYVNILGADPASGNPALASRGRAERVLLEGDVPATVLRVPMVLGEGDYASIALMRRARGRIAWLVRGESLEQPIYAGDVVAAIAAAIADRSARHRVFELAGPESLSRRALVERAAALAGSRVRCVSVPLAPVLTLVGIAERAMADPPITRAMLGVLDHDDHIDPRHAANELGIRLTGLDEMLRRCVVETGKPR